MEQFPNMRLTTQRQIILEELEKVTSHPTANEVYDMVRRRLPRIGLGTVYRNLELMADSGIILKLEVGGTQKRDVSNERGRSRGGGSQGRNKPFGGTQKIQPQLFVLHQTHLLRFAVHPDCFPTLFRRSFGGSAAQQHW